MKTREKYTLLALTDDWQTKSSVSQNYEKEAQARGTKVENALSNTHWVLQKFLRDGVAEIAIFDPPQIEYRLSATGLQLKKEFLTLEAARKTKSPQQPLVTTT